LVKTNKLKNAITYVNNDVINVELTALMHAFHNYLFTVEEAVRLSKLRDSNLY